MLSDIAVMLLAGSGMTALTLYVVIVKVYECIKSCIYPTLNGEVIQGRVEREILDGIKDFVFESQISEDLPFGTEDCVICLHALEQGQRLLVIPSCHHVYHSDCIQPVMLQRSTCPVCRRHISLEDGAATDEKEIDSVV